MPETITLMVGTTKGAFLLTSDASRDAWSISGPHCSGWSINHMAGDPRSGMLWAVGGGEWEGAGVWRSEDGGASWHVSILSAGQREDWIRDNRDFADHAGMRPYGPGPFDGQLDALWAIRWTPTKLYVGGKPARLYTSDDNGATWASVKGLNEHESRETWAPGGAGLTLHTIVPSADNADHLWIGISAAGVFATEDGGKTWERRNRRDSMAAMTQFPGDDPHEIGKCVHSMVRADGAPEDMLYMQNHHGAFRSQNGGLAWHEISDGLPSKFGFPIAVHPHKPETIWVFPLNGDTQGRFPPEASAKVWRSRDGGQSWTAHQKGLPKENCYFTVLRQSMATDRAEQPGLYFGTNSGSIFASLDEGDTWNEIARHLPTVLSVECLHRV